MNSTYAAPKQSTVSATSATICGHTISRLWSSESRDPICWLAWIAWPIVAGADTWVASG